MLGHFRCLPSELNRQAPGDIWRVLAKWQKEANAEYEKSIPEGLGWFYGG